MDDGEVGRGRGSLGWWVAGAVATGVFLGWLGATVVFVGSGLSLVPWALVSIGIGVVIARRRSALVVASIFGFALAASFMAFGYDGADPIAGKIGFFAVLGLVGAACASALALAANAVHEDRTSVRSDPSRIGCAVM